MIEDSGPRKIIWLLGVLAVLGNLAVIAWRLIRRDDHPVQTCLLTNLAVSDFLMGVYLMIVAIQDQIWAGMGFDHQSVSVEVIQVLFFIDTAFILSLVSKRFQIKVMKKYATLKSEEITLNLTF